MQNESNYFLYQRLTPTNWASALVAKSARTELERRANNGDGEAKMLLTLHDCDEEKRSRQPIRPIQRVKNFKERAAKIKIFYHLNLE